MSDRKTSWYRNWARPLGALGLAGALVLGVAAPALADPGNPAPPDSGARPNPGGGAPAPLPPGGQPGLPGAGKPGLPDGNPPAVDPPAMGPLASRINAEQREVERLGEQLKDTNQRLADLRKLLESTRRAATAADQAVARTEALIENTAAEAYRDSVAVPEQLRKLATGLEHLAPGLRDNSAVEGKAAADSYRAALELADAAHDALQAAEQAVSAAQGDTESLKREFEQRSKALRELQQRNADALREAEEAANRYAEKIDYDPGAAVKGLLANPLAVKAVRYALAQLGKPYVWGNEGPNSFDCSGLVWAAYRYAGVTMQARTARAQYYSTRLVPPNRLLPGDLIFFGPDKTNPESIHHVGIYIGNSRIVHAPTAGDVVKVSPIWWWEFFAATRVVPAVKAPSAKPKPKPTSPKPTAKPTSPKPDPTSSTSPRPSPSGSPSPSPSPSDPTTPPPSPTPSTTPSAPSASASPSGSAPADSPAATSPAGVCPTASPSASGSPSPSPTGSASPSPDPCRVTPASTVSDPDTGTDLNFAWVFLDPFQKSATVATRRRTRLTCYSNARRRRLV